MFSETPNRLPAPKQHRCPLELLDLTSNHIGDEGLRLLAHGIFWNNRRRQHRLQVLDLMYNLCTVDGVLRFCAAMEAAVSTQPPVVPFLREVNFSLNELTAEDRATVRARFGGLVDRGLVVLE